MHVESPTASTFSLGQFFAVWGVRLSKSCIGGECAGSGKQLRAWVNGEPVDADPTRIVLAEKQEIVLAIRHRRAGAQADSGELRRSRPACRRAGAAQAVRRRRSTARRGAP